MKLRIVFSIWMCAMFVQHFELQGSCFTNFRYYYFSCSVHSTCPEWLTGCKTPSYLLTFKGVDENVSLLGSLINTFSFLSSRFLLFSDWIRCAALTCGRINNMENNNASASDVEPKQELEGLPTKPEPIDTGKKAFNRAGVGECSYHFPWQKWINYSICKAQNLVHWDYSKNIHTHTHTHTHEHSDYTIYKA